MDSMLQHRRRAFTLVELLVVLGIIGILAAIVIPKFVVATDESLASSAYMQLNSTRRALERYKVEHRDQYPALEEMWDVMLHKTDADGSLNPEGSFGPYLIHPPRNPFNSRVSLTSPGQNPADHGWIYDPTARTPLQLVGFDEDTGKFSLDHLD